MVRIDLLKQLDRVRFIFSPIMSCLLRKFLASGLACHGSAAAEAAESEPSHAACSGGVGGGVGVHAAACSASTRLGKALSD